MNPSHETTAEESTQVSPPVTEGNADPVDAKAAVFGPPIPPVAFVVEDEGSIGSLLAFILEREGFKVEWKTNGRDADRFIHRNEAPKIVLLDIVLPDIDGYGLLRIIRGHPSWRLAPVLMLTALSLRTDVTKAMSDGSSDYMVKPFHPAELVRRVNKLCGRCGLPPMAKPRDGIRVQT